MGVNPSTAPKIANPMIEAMTEGIRASTSKSLRYKILGSENGASQRRAEDRADARTDADGDRDPRVGRGEVELTGQQRSEPGADLGGGPLTSRRSARSDRDRGRDDLDERDRPRIPFGLWWTASIAASVP